MLRAFIFIAPFLLSSQAFAQQDPSTQDPEVAAPDTKTPDDLAWMAFVKSTDENCSEEDGAPSENTPTNTLDEIARRLQVSPKALTVEMQIQNNYDQFALRFEPIQKNSSDLKVGQEAISELRRLNSDSVDPTSGTRKIESESDQIYIFSQQKDGAGVTTTCLPLGRNRKLARARLDQLVEEPSKKTSYCFKFYDKTEWMKKIFDADRMKFAYKTKNIKQDRNVYACQTVQAGS